RCGRSSTARKELELGAVGTYFQIVASPLILVGEARIWRRALDHVGRRAIERTGSARNGVGNTLLRGVIDPHFRIQSLLPQIISTATCQPISATAAALGGRPRGDTAIAHGRRIAP